MALAILGQKVRFIYMTDFVFDSLPEEQGQQLREAHLIVGKRTAVEYVSARLGVQSKCVGVLTRTNGSPELNGVWVARAAGGVGLSPARRGGRFGTAGGVEVETWIRGAVWDRPEHRRCREAGASRETMMREQHTDRFWEVVVLAMVPGIVGALILVSWALAHWEIGPLYLNAGLALLATLFGGWHRFLGGFQDVIRRRITVNVFVTLALIATLAVGEFRPAAIIIFIMAVVGALESYTLDKNRQSIRNLLDLAPQTATVRRGAEEATVPVGEVEAGMVVVVRLGERVPVDGVVVAGASSVNQAPITGESMPVEKFKGSELFSGTLNLTSRVEVRATKGGRTRRWPALCIWWNRPKGPERRSKTWPTASQSGSCRWCWCWRSRFSS